MDLELIHSFSSLPFSPAVISRAQAKLADQHGGGASVPNLHDVTARMARVVERQRIESHEQLATALEVTLKKLLKVSEGDRDGLLRPERLPDALQLLILLAAPPTKATSRYASDLLTVEPEPPPKPITWAGIIAEENLQGEDWDELRRGRPLPRKASSSSSEEEPQSASSSSSSDTASFPPTPNKPRRRRSRPPAPEPTHSLFTQLVPDDHGLASLARRQYWSPDHLAPSSTGQLKSNDPSSLAGALAADAAREDPCLGVIEGQYWEETDVVREVLGALQGRGDAGLYERTSGVISVSRRAPSVLHLSPRAFHSLLGSFIPSLSALSSLQSFVDATLRHPQTPLPYYWSPTIVAYAEAVSLHLRAFYHWCATLEATILSPKEDTVVSLLHLSSAVEERHKTLQSLVLALRTFSDPSFLSTSPPLGLDKQHPCEATTALLNFLQAQVELAYAVGNLAAAEELRSVFVGTVEPLWALLGQWVRKGRLTARRRNEFFVRRNEDVLVADPDFFRDGFELWTRHDGEAREGEGSTDEEARIGVPKLLENIAKDALQCGKAVYLLSTMAPGEEWLEDGEDVEWPTFAKLVAGARGLDVGATMAPKSDAVLAANPATTVRNALITARSPPPEPTKPILASPSPHSTSSSFSQTLSDVISDLCSPLFRLVHYKLHHVFLEDCRLGYHLTAIQGVFLMRKGWEVGSFLSGLFEAMDRGQAWTDFHFLNSTWSKALGSADWTDATLVRFRVGSKQSRSTLRSVKVFSSLQIEYSVPWPLVYILSSETMDLYSQIFTFLLQIRRAKHLVDRLSLVKPSDSGFAATQSEHELKLFYSLRRKLSWIVATLFDFFMSFVVQKEIDAFEAIRKRSTSVQELVDAHQAHVLHLRDRLLLNDKALPIHRSIISILDLCVSTSDTWTTLHCDTAAESSRRFSESLRLRRSTNKQSARRRRRGARESAGSAPEGSSSDEDDDGEEGEDELSIGPSASFVSLADEGFSLRVERMDKDVDGLIGFVRRGVEGLAKSTPSPDVREVYSLLSFRLND